MRLMDRPVWELDNWCPNKNRLGVRVEISKKLYEIAKERYFELDKEMGDLENA